MMLPSQNPGIGDYANELKDIALAYNPKSKFEKLMDHKVVSFVEVCGLLFGFSYLTADSLGDRSYHTTGFINGFLGRALDYISTHRAVKEQQDPRFREYGLDTLETAFQETNPSLGKFPDKHQLYSFKNIFPDLTVILLSAVYPPVGYTAAVDGIETNLINNKVANLIRRAIQVGDRVKSFINEGLSEDGVRKYLSYLEEEIKKERKNKKFKEILDETAIEFSERVHH